MPAYCFDFNDYKQANVNMVIRSWQHYRRFSGAISFLYHHDNLYPRADPGIFIGFGGGRGGGSPVTKKSSDVVFSLLFSVSPQLILQRESSDHGFFKENYNLTITFRYSMEKGAQTFPGGSTFSWWRGSNYIFLYKPIEFVIFQGSGVRTPATSSGSARGIVNWVRRHIVLAKRLKA